MKYYNISYSNVSLLPNVCYHSILRKKHDKATVLLLLILPPIQDSVILLVLIFPETLKYTV